MARCPTADRFVGLAIAAAPAAGAWQRPAAPRTPALTSAHPPAGSAARRERLQATGGAPARTLVVLEATGSSWISGATTLHQAGAAVSGSTPAAAHAVANALRKRAQTAAIAAPTRPQLAALRPPAPWTPPPPVDHDLRHRPAQRAALRDLRPPVRNQHPARIQHPTGSAAVRARMAARITTLRDHIAAVEAERAPARAQDAAWAAAAARLHPITGLGG